MTRPWYSRLYHFLVDEEAPVLIVATPLHQDAPPVAPLTIVAQSRDVTAALGKIEAKGKRRAVKASKRTVRRQHKGKQS